MVQIQIVEGKNVKEMQDATNAFLAGLKDEEVLNIKYDFTHPITIVEYSKVEAWRGRMCMDCKHWDDGNSHDSVSGLCQMCGGRKRFNCSACSNYADVRE